jgi:hypothetical protein
MSRNMMFLQIYMFTCKNYILIEAQGIPAGLEESHVEVSK